MALFAMMRFAYSPAGFSFFAHYEKEIFKEEEEAYNALMSRINPTHIIPPKTY